MSPPLVRRSLLIQSLSRLPSRSPGCADADGADLVVVFVRGVVVPCQSGRTDLAADLDVERDLAALLKDEVAARRAGSRAGSARGRPRGTGGAATAPGAAASPSRSAGLPAGKQARRLGLGAATGPARHSEARASGADDEVELSSCRDGGGGDGRAPLVVPVVHPRRSARSPVRGRPPAAA